MNGTKSSKVLHSYSEGGGHSDLGVIQIEGGIQV